MMTAHIHCIFYIIILCMKWISVIGWQISNNISNGKHIYYGPLKICFQILINQNNIVPKKILHCFDVFMILPLFSDR